MFWFLGKFTLYRNTEKNATHYVLPISSMILCPLKEGDEHLFELAFDPYSFLNYPAAKSAKQIAPIRFPFMTFDGFNALAKHPWE